MTETGFPVFIYSLSPVILSGAPAQLKDLSSLSDKILRRSAPQNDKNLLPFSSFFFGRPKGSKERPESPLDFFSKCNLFSVKHFTLSVRFASSSSGKLQGAGRAYDYAGFPDRAVTPSA